MNSSEIITNSDGSIYHLSLLPEHLADTIITVGDPDRVGQVSRHFERIDFQHSSREFVSHLGWYRNKRILVISTGIGTDNIDIVFNELELLANYDLHSGEALEKRRSLDYIRIGTSGALRPEIPIGSVLLSEAALGFDGLLHFYANANEAYENYPLKGELSDLPTPYYTRANAELAANFEGVFTHLGTTLTAPGFYAPQGRRAAAEPKLPHFIQLAQREHINGKQLTNLEMETAGIYGLAKLFGHRAISLSAILANRATAQFSSAPQEEVERLIAAVLNRLAEL